MIYLQLYSCEIEFDGYAAKSDENLLYSLFQNLCLPHD